ncbi:MAG: hypothetical protein ACLTYN_00460 [Dysosmobacter welbionis]
MGVSALEDLRLLNRYDVEGLDEAAFRRAVGTVFSEPQVDDTAAALPAGDCIAFGVEPLPGQFDQRADSAAQCIQLMTQEERPTVRTARIYLLFGPLTAADVDAVKRYVLNPWSAGRRLWTCRSGWRQRPPSRQTWKRSRASLPWTGRAWIPCWRGWVSPWTWRTCRSSRHTSGTRSAGTPP